MKKDLGVIFGLFSIVILLIVFGRGYTSFNFGYQATESALTNKVVKDRTQVLIKNLSVSAKIALNAAEQSRGLGNYESLPISEGMLFVFAKNGTYPFWMKDMKFAIDIIWIDESKKIVYIVENAAAEMGKKDRELKVFKPNAQARYVLEVNAGLTKLNGIVVGDIANFEL